MSTPTKVGLLGAGYILEAHATALAALPGVTLHAVCDVSRGRAVSAATKFEIPHVLTSIADLSASECQVVHILLPPAMHVDAAFAMVDAGKSVFIEKPMGLDSEACSALCMRAAEKNVAVAVNHNFLFAPRYEALREGLLRGELGRIDHVSASWHFAAPILKFGPFDGWMLAAPSNMLFEVGSHVAAFIVDLIGVPEIVAAVAANPIELPAAQTVFRQWTAVGRTASATASISISLTAGHADRILRIRGLSGSAQVDFGRDIGWRDSAVSDNPIFDSYATAATAGHMLTGQAARDRRRRLRAALLQRPDANPFEESVFRSIRAFYDGGKLGADPRHNPRLGGDVVRLCENIAAAANTGTPSRESVSIPAPTARVKPTVLIVGGTGFIGRRLVAKLVQRGHGVRVMTRNARAAAIELHGLPIELFAGSHGDAECVSRALDGIKSVYHLAKCEGKRWHDYLEGDVRPTQVLGEAALAARVERFIYTGTIASYASGDRGAVIDNRTPVDPHIVRRGHYARSKAACEAVLQSLQRTQGLPLVILRPGIVIGPGSPPAHPGVGRFLTETRVDYWGDGTNALPLVLVDDVAEALALALDAPGLEGQTLLLTSPPLMTARQYVAAVAKHTHTLIDARPRSAWANWTADMIKEGAKQIVRHPNRRWPSLHDWQSRSNRSRFDGSMSERVLGWTPINDCETMVSRGINATIDWFLR